MKKLLLLLSLCGYLLTAAAQTATDSNGDKIYRGNIAVFVREDKYVFDSKSPQQKITKTPTKNNVETATYAWITQNLQNEGFRIVNRDDILTKDVIMMLNEQKSEDYLNGLSNQAKNQGADWLLLVDMTTLVEENKYITFDHSYRLISVENNIGYHAQTEQKFIWRGTEAFRQEMAQSITENRAFFINFVRRFFPVQFGITEVKGSHVKLAAYQPVGALTKDDKVYIYHYGNEKALYQGQEEEFNVLKLLAIGDNFRLDGGYLVAKTDNAIKSAENTFACLTEKNTLALEQRFFTSLIELPYDTQTREGYLKKRVNQAVYCAIGQLPQLGLIESSMLPKLKDERELQKGEAFMDGHTVEQFKAVGASFLITISNFKTDVKNPDIVSFTLSFLDVASNVIIKTFDVRCHISNLDKAAKYYLSYVFTFPCAVSKIDNKTVELYSKAPIGANVGDSFILTFIKTTATPNGAPVSQRVELATLKYAEYQGMKHKFIIDKIQSKTDMKHISEYLNTTNFFLLTNSPEPELIKVASDEFGKQKKKSGFMSRLANAVTVQAASDEQGKQKKMSSFKSRLANAVTAQ